MDYFVSIENKTYFHWQLELLIESFKLHNLEDSLLIAVAENAQPCNPGFVKNLQNHKRIATHENCPSDNKILNKFHSLYSVVQNGLLKQPFCIIHPDEVLLSPPVVGEENIAFQLLLEEEHEATKDIIQPMIEEIIGKLYQPLLFDYFELGANFIFNDVPVIFFADLANNLNMLVERYKDIKYEKGAFLITLCEYLGKLKFKNRLLESNLLGHNIQSNFIHYNRGLPPVFDKKYFFYNEQLAYSEYNDPYQLLLSQNPTTNTNYMQTVVNSYLKNK